MRSGELDDEACLRALGANRDRTFEVLFERYSDAVYNVAFRRTASWSAAEDIAASTFLELWRQRRRVVASPRLRHPRPLGNGSDRAR